MAKQNKDEMSAKLAQFIKAVDGKVITGEASDYEPAFIFDADILDVPLTFRSVKLGSVTSYQGKEIQQYNVTADRENGKQIVIQAAHGWVAVVAEHLATKKTPLRAKICKVKDKYLLRPVMQ